MQVTRALPEAAEGSVTRGGAPQLPQCAHMRTRAARVALSLAVLCSSVCSSMQLSSPLAFIIGVLRRLSHILAFFFVDTNIF